MSDQAYPNLVGPIVLPARFRLVGLGIQGDAVLAFPAQPDFLRIH
jgi:hypothetical protein